MHSVENVPSAQVSLEATADTGDREIWMTTEPCPVHPQTPTFDQPKAPVPNL